MPDFSSLPVSIFTKMSVVDGKSVSTDGEDELFALVIGAVSRFVNRTETVVTNETSFFSLYIFGMVSY